MISLIVPIYKAEAHLKKCVESFLKQTDGRYEVILVDDGSPDGCPALCDDFAAKDDRIRVIHKSNRGVVSARNRGVEAARGEYVCFVDSDDWVSSRLIETLESQAVQALRPDVIVFNYCCVFEDRKEKSALRYQAGFYNRAEMEKVIFPRLISDRKRGRWWQPGIPVYVWGKAFRTAFLRQHLFQDETIALSEDAAMTFENILAAQSLLLCDACLYYYNRANAQSVSRAYRTDLCEMYSHLFVYMTARLGRKREEIDRQLNDYFAYRVLRGVNIDVEHGLSIGKAAEHLSEAFERSRIMGFVRLKGLPWAAKSLIFLLKQRRYKLLLMILKGWQGLKERRHRVEKGVKGEEYGEKL